MKKKTIFSELMIEFSSPLGKCFELFSSLAKRSPKAIYASMIVLMIGSLFLCFSYLRKAPEKAVSERLAISKVHGELNEIGLVADRIRSVLEIKEALKVLLAKDSLNSKDSILMVKMIAQLETKSRTKH